VGAWIVDHDLVGQGTRRQHPFQGVVAFQQQGRRPGAARPLFQVRRRVLDPGAEAQALAAGGLAQHPHDHRVALGQPPSGPLAERQQPGPRQAELDEGRVQRLVHLGDPPVVEVAQVRGPVRAPHHQVGQPAVLEPGGAGLAGQGGDDQPPGHGM